MVACADSTSTPSDAGLDVQDAHTTTVRHENCFNEIDDNGDLLVDCADPECRRLDSCRVFQCPDGDIGDAVGSAAFRASTEDANNDLEGSCGGQGGDDLALLWTAPESREYFIDTRWGSYDTVLYVRDGGCDGPELACNDDADTPRALQSEVRIGAEAGRTYLIVVDGYQIVAGDHDAEFVLNITPADLNAEAGYCSDRRDNDEDGLTDCADEECADDPACRPLEGVTDVAAGRSHTCAIADGAILCWGANARGQLGNGARSSETRPVALVADEGETLPERWDRIETWADTTCAVASGAVWCWGADDYQRLLQDEAGDRLHPVRLPLDGAVADVAVGGTHMCALFESGAVQCWGGNSAGELGAEPDQHGGPYAVDSVGSVDALDLGAQHTCLLDEDRALWCFGARNAGQYTDGPNGPTPIRVAEGVRQVATGGSHTCVIDGDGDVRCVGQNWTGQLGDGSTQRRGDWVDSGPNTPLAQLACSAYHCCGVAEEGPVWCWGYNPWGQLGTGDYDQRLRATRTDLNDASVVRAGQEHSCALADGRVWCWGNGRNGELGNGTREQSPVPVRVLAPR